MVEVRDFFRDDAFCCVEFVAGGLDFRLHGIESLHEFELLVFNAADIGSRGLNGCADGLILLVFSSLRTLHFVLLDLFTAGSNVFFEH